MKKPQRKRSSVIDQTGSQALKALARVTTKIRKASK